MFDKKCAQEKRRNFVKGNSFIIGKKSACSLTTSTSG